MTQKPPEKPNQQNDGSAVRPDDPSQKPAESPVGARKSAPDAHEGAEAHRPSGDAGSAPPNSASPQNRARAQAGRQETQPKPSQSGEPKPEAGNPPSGFWTRKRLYWGGAAAVALVALAVFLLPGDEGPRYFTEKLARGPFLVTVSAVGRLEARNKTEVKAGMEGRVLRILVQEGDAVVPGQILAELDVAELKAKIAQADAQAAAARATANEIAAGLSDVRIKSERAEALYRRNILRNSDVQEAQADFLRVSANAARARADAQLAQSQSAASRALLQKAQIHAPMSGIVLRVGIEQGDTLSSYSRTPLFTLADDISVMEVKVNIPEDKIAHLAEGQTAIIATDAYPNRRFGARLQSLATVPNESEPSDEAAPQVSYGAVLLVNNQDRYLRPGLNAKTDIVITRSNDAFSVPNIALRFTPRAQRVREAPQLPAAKNGEKWARVWVLEGDEPQPRAVKLGLSDGRRTLVTEGNLREGETIIIDVAGPRVD